LDVSNAIEAVEIQKRKALIADIANGSRASNKGFNEIQRKLSRLWKIMMNYHKSPSQSKIVETKRRLLSPEDFEKWQQTRKH
jgi:hypothetical protein